MIFLMLLLSAQWTSAYSPEIGLGTSNNVNYSDSNQQSDSYYWLKSYNELQRLNLAVNLWVSYKDFFKESQNDVLNWRTGLHFPNPFFFGESYFDLGLGGQNFTSISPQTTDEGYDSYYFEMALIKTINWQRIGELALEPGYQIKHFDEVRRVDHRLYLTGAFDFSVNPVNTLTPSVEIGFVSSSDNLYSKNYLEFGLDWEHSIRSDLDFVFSVFNRASWFPNRNLTSISLLNANKKNQRTLSQNEIETQNFSQIEISMLKSFEKLSTKGTIIKTAQSSKSESENFDEFGVRIAFIFNF
jgi:hypothetical protein